MRTTSARLGRLLVLSAVVLLAVACAVIDAPEPGQLGSTSSTLPSPARTGVAQVTIDSAGYTFEVTSCVIAADVFSVDGTNEDGATLLIRHASPPTRDPAEPAMSVLVVASGDRWEAPPAALTFDVYDPGVGQAIGSTPVNRDGPDGPESVAEFEVTCFGRSGT